MLLLLTDVTAKSASGLSHGYVIHIKWDIIFQPCPNFKLGHGWEITSHTIEKYNYLSIPWSQLISLNERGPGPWFNIKMSSYQYRKSHCGDKTVVRLSYLHSGISYTGKMTSLYWFDPQDSLKKSIRYFIVNSRKILKAWVLHLKADILSDSAEISRV